MDVGSELATSLLWMMHELLLLCRIANVKTVKSSSSSSFSFSFLFFKWPLLVSLAVSCRPFLRMWFMTQFLSYLFLLWCNFHLISFSYGAVFISVSVFVARWLNAWNRPIFARILSQQTWLILSISGRWFSSEMFLRFLFQVGHGIESEAEVCKSGRMCRNCVVCTVDLLSVWLAFIISSLFFFKF